jgi:hypothetical protein
VKILSSNHFGFKAAEHTPIRRNVHAARGPCINKGLGIAVEESKLRLSLLTGPKCIVHQFKRPINPTCQLSTSGNQPVCPAPKIKVSRHSIRNQTDSSMAQTLKSHGLWDLYWRRNRQASSCPKISGDLYSMDRYILVKNARMFATSHSCASDGSLFLVGFRIVIRPKVILGNDHSGQPSKSRIPRDELRLASLRRGIHDRIRHVQPVVGAHIRGCQRDHLV